MLRETPKSIAEALPAEIKRVTEKKERWLGYMREHDMGPAALGMQLSINIMAAEIDEAVNALASGDVVRMLHACETLRGYTDDD